MHFIIRKINLHSISVCCMCIIVIFVCFRSHSISHLYVIEHNIEINHSKSIHSEYGVTFFFLFLFIFEMPIKFSFGFFKQTRLLFCCHWYCCCCCCCCYCFRMQCILTQNVIICLFRVRVVCIHISRVVENGNSTIE